MGGAAPHGSIVLDSSCSGGPVAPRGRRPSFMIETSVSSKPVVPKWRGITHELAILPVSCIGVYAVISADGVLATTALAVHVTMLVALLTTSAIYHRHCSTERARTFARRADHAAIFGLIAGSYVPLSLLAVPKAVGIPVLIGAWLVALAGARLKMRLELGQDRFHSWMYAALGGSGVILLPWLISDAGLARVGWIVIGGLAYSAGGVALIRQRPNPWPGHFGFHEIWHAAVLVGAMSHLGVSISLT